MARLMGNFRKTIRVSRLQSKHRMMGAAFNPAGLGENVRRRSPWLGLAWYEPGMDEKRAAFIHEWEAETERLLKLNPKLRIVD